MSGNVKDTMARPDWFPRCACGRSVLNDGDACTVCQPNDVVPRSATLAEDVRWLREKQAVAEATADGLSESLHGLWVAQAARYTRIADALERGEKADHKAALLARTVDRYLPCPDHRDKVDGRCYVCALETVTRERDKLRDLVEKIGADPFVAAAIRASRGGANVSA